MWYTKTHFYVIVIIVGLVVIIIAATSPLIRGYEPDNDIDRMNGAAVGAIVWTTKKPSRGW